MKLRSVAMGTAQVFGLVEGRVAYLGRRRLCRRRDGGGEGVLINCAANLHLFSRILWGRRDEGGRVRKIDVISGLVVEYIVAIDVTRARFPADEYGHNSCSRDLAEF